MNINEIMKQLAELLRLQKDLEAEIDAAKDQIKAYMQENDIDAFSGLEHWATYRDVTSARIDTTALKKDLPEIAAKYTKNTTSKRFVFA